MSEFDPTRIEDELQDLNENVESLVGAILAAGTSSSPVVNVPQQAAPAVHVSAPSVKIDSPVTVLPAKAVTWVFCVTQRDDQGLIKEFTATPQ